MPTEKEKDQLQWEGEEFDTKYMAELRQLWNAYMYALINEIYVGVGVNLGLLEKKAYDMAKSNPEKLEKANFFKSIFDKFKDVFRWRIPKFRYKKKLYNDGEPMTPEQWKRFDDSVDKFLPIMQMKLLKRWVSHLICLEERQQSSEKRKSLIRINPCTRLNLISMMEICQTQ